MRAAHLRPGTPPACAASAARTRVNCRGLPAAAAPLGPEDALAEAQPRRPSDRPDALLPQYPGSTPAARSWADSLWGRGQNPGGSRIQPPDAHSPRCTAEPVRLRPDRPETHARCSIRAPSDEKPRSAPA
ncbi:hypothetical protein NN561_009967 [Cricetulus griseus]